MKFITSVFLCASIFIFSCNERNKTIQHIDFNTIIENDTLLFKDVPKNLHSWLSYYKKFDPLFTLSTFKASGVVLHMPELKESDTISFSRLKLEPLFEYSPDRMSYIDLWSYGQGNIPEKAWDSRSELAKSISNVEPDQQVVLALQNGKRYELMFNGPSTFSDFADWINNEQFLISQITSDNNGYIFELFIFDIKEKLFTNYRLDHVLQLNFEKESFFEFWLNETDKLIK